MICRCPECGNQFDSPTPGTVRCPACHSPFEIKPEQFEWTAGTHLDDSSKAAEPPIAVPIDNPSATDKVLCGICRQRAAVRACASCGKLICETCSTRESADSLPVCVHCASQRGTEPGFDQFTKDNFFQRLFATIRELVLRPSAFFEKLPKPGNLWAAIIFGVVVAWPGGVIELVANLIFQPELADFLGEMFQVPEDFNSYLKTPVGLLSLAAGALFLPISLLVGIFVKGAITHLILLLLGRMRGSFEDTIRVTGYSNVAHLAKLLPLLGSIIAYVWGVAIMAIGLSRVHKIPMWKALVAILGPVLICCCGLAAFFSIFFSALAAYMAGV